jgi:predicted RNA-binding protein (virulence factor B family)
MIEIGKYNELKVVSQSPAGFYLGDGTETVLLPLRYAGKDLGIGDVLEVFVYPDNQDRPVATTLRPYAVLDQFACLTVKEVTDFGAFLDWGIDKDLFIAFSEQRKPLSKGDKVIVYIFLDGYSGRIAATTRWSGFLEDTSDLKAGDEVELLIAETTPLGYRAIINQSMEGVLYQNEVFEDLRPGDTRRAYVRVVRPDGKVDLRLRQEGYGHIEESKFMILKLLKENSGTLKLGDKSSPDEIYNLLKMSKKTFKQAIGGLFKEGILMIGDHEISLKDSDVHGIPG